MSRYGPHDPEAAPKTVTVFRSEQAGGDYEAPIPDVLIRQRAQLNTLAFLGFRPLEHAETIERFRVAGVAETDDDLWTRGPVGPVYHDALLTLIHEEVAPA